MCGLGGGWVDVHVPPCATACTLLCVILMNVQRFKWTAASANAFHLHVRVHAQGPWNLKACCCITAPLYSNAFHLATFVLRRN